MSDHRHDYLVAPRWSEVEPRHRVPGSTMETCPLCAYPVSVSPSCMRALNDPDRKPPLRLICTPCFKPIWAVEGDDAEVGLLLPGQLRELDPTKRAILEQLGPEALGKYWRETVGMPEVRKTD